MRGLPEGQARGPGLQSRLLCNVEQKGPGCLTQTPELSCKYLTDPLEEVRATSQGFLGPLLLLVLHPNS